MVPLLSRDLARAGTVTCAMAHAAGASHALPGRVDGSTAAAGRPRLAPPGPPPPPPPPAPPPPPPPRRGKRPPPTPPPAPAAISPERDHPPMTGAFKSL